MSKIRVVQVSKPGGPLELVERELPQPGRGEVRLRVEACGICHSDSMAKEGHMPGVPYPIVPGHEIAGRIDALGEGVTGWQVGDRVGVGWFGAHCGGCEACRRGFHVNCSQLRIPGMNYDGGYAEAMVTPAAGLARLPAELSPADAAPLLCAGVTTFNALRNSPAKAGDVVAVLGLGGLGHLGVQFAVKMGFRTVAIARGQDKAPLAKQLGAHHYLDSDAVNVGEALQKLGGARVILATAVNSDAISSMVGGLGVQGQLLVVGAPPQPLQVSVYPLLGSNRSVKGWASGTSIDSEDTVNFSVLTNVRAMIESYPLEKASEAYERMMSGKSRFRVVLTMQ
ncbi:MAG TPA: alcohol dehydrogenase [Pseudomonadota bacterium]|nr:alcohol dehydrogenase [Pseudomonadota bacterium]